PDAFTLLRFHGGLLLVFPQEADARAALKKFTLEVLPHRVSITALVKKGKIEASVGHISKSEFQSEHVFFRQD
ncbi:hypothetical protein, partial [Thermogutta sp.]|uniref:hypothetical protein n=1 Tax=Thermogutta sp. TaxID=1962930 RepID=UPI003C7BC395